MRTLFVKIFSKSWIMLGVGFVLVGPYVGFGVTGRVVFVTASHHHASIFINVFVLVIFW